jgi:RHS repeat-associated protein
MVLFGEEGDVRFSLWVLFVLFVCVFGCFGVVPGVAFGLGSVNGLSSLSGDALVVPGAEVLLPGQVGEVEAARRASPEAVDARAASVTAYEGFGVSAAERLTGEVFPGLVEEQEGGPPVLPVGDAITRFVSRYAAQADLGEGRRGVVESMEPMAFELSSGVLEPVDLGLHEANGVFEPVMPLVGVRIPRVLSEGVALPGVDVSVTPVDASGSPLGSVGHVDHASVFYGDSEDAEASNMDTIVKPWTGGLEVDTVLRSGDSPQQLYFRVGLPSGASLEQQAGSGRVQIVEAGEVIGAFSTPSARDAEGTSVPVSMSVSGDMVTLTVNHGSGDYRYPIVVDPRLTCELTKEPLHGNWHFESEGSWFTGRENSEENTWVINAGADHNEKEWGAAVYTTQKLSHISYLSAVASLNTKGAHVESRLELASKNGVEKEETLPEESKFYHSRNLECKIGEEPPYCKVDAEYNNSAVLTALASGWGTGVSGEDVLEKAYMVIEQLVYPEVRFDTTDEKVDGEPNALYGDTWLGPHTGALVKVTAVDEGIGLEGWSTEHTNGSGVWEGLSEKSLSSEGLCSGVQCPDESVGYIGYSSALPNGEPKIGADAWDAMSKSHAKENEPESLRRVTVRVDSSPPHGIVVKGLLPGNEIGEGQYKLTVQAIDGFGTTPSSGVRSIVLSIDGQEIGGPKGSCSPGPCAAYGEWTINGAEFGAGEHKLKITATDNADNVATEELTLKVRHSQPIADGPGQVNPQSGAFILSSADVSIGAPGAGLGISRTYNSRRPNAGSEGPLGAQWSLSVDGQESVSRASNGNATLTLSNGAQMTFTSNGSGGFTSPTASANLTLSEEKNSKGELTEYVLKDPATGSATRFTSSSGPTSTLWVPSKQEGVLSTQMVRYTFQTVEVEGKKITRPVRELAPEPAGVSCSGELKIGCRALTFTYATKTTASGENPSEWAEYDGRLMKVSLVAYNPSAKAISEVAVAQYAYDAQGRLRAEWDPRVSPSLKTTYGYDSEGHVSALSPPGEQPWLFSYGTSTNDASTGRLLSVTRPSASTELGAGSPPSHTGGLALSPENPVIGTTESVTGGSWSNAPLAYTYQWEDCSSEEGCTPILGANNATYTPVPSNAGYLLAVKVSATNADGTSTPILSAAREVPLPASEYTEKFGEAGETSWEFKEPTADAIDSEGNVWVADTNNARIEEFSNNGSFITAFGWGVSNGKNEFQACIATCRAGIAGSGSGQFSKPEGIAINKSTGEIYITEKSNNRIQVFNSFGEVIGKFGEGGQVNAPLGIAIESRGNVWVADSGNDRVDEFTATGEFMGSFGDAGEELGQFKTPTGVAFSGSYAYIVDSGNDRVQKCTLSGDCVSSFGSKGSEVGKFSAPIGIASDPASGDLYVADTGNNRVQELNPAGVFLQAFGKHGSGNGEFSSPDGVAVNNKGKVYVTDQHNNRIEKFSPTYSTNDPLPEPPSVGTSAVSTIEYNVPVSGSGAPYAMGNGEVEGWAQKDLPVEAVAVFPASEPQGWPAKDYKNATVYYLDNEGRTVNVASPSGGISTTEYNETDDVIRALSPDNRVKALKEAKPKEASELLATVSKYDGETKEEKEKEEKEKISEAGTKLLETLGPQHTVKLASGSETLARSHTVYSYDEGAPSEGGPYRLVTKVTQGAEIIGKEEADVRTTTTSYSGQENLGWKLRAPTSVAANPSGLKVTHTTVYEPSTGSVLETRQPKDASGESSPPVYSAKFAASGSGAGQLNTPVGMAVDSSGNVWVADSANNRIEKFSSSGSFIMVLGWGVSNGEAKYQTCTSSCRAGIEGEGNGEFSEPKAIAINPTTGDLYIVDTGNDRIQELSSAGAFIRTFGSAGSGSGDLSEPQGLAIDAKGDVWVADAGNDRIEEFNEEGKSPATFGSAGTGTDQFQTPNDITISWGNLYVADFANDRIDELSPTGAFIQASGYGVLDGAAKAEVCTTMCRAGIAGSGNGEFSSPARIATDPNSGDIYVADHGNTRVVELAPGGRYLGKFGASGSGEGQFTNLKGVVVNSSGDVYTADAGNSRIEQWDPPSSGNSGAHDTLNVYYTAAANPLVASCGDHPEWAGLACQAQPLVQPETSGLPDLPVNTISEYNMLDEPLTSVQTAGSSSRTSKTTYDEAGRVLTSETTATTGTALPKVSYKYEEHTGALIEQSTTVAGKTQALKSAFNTLGQLTSYTDAGENTTTYEYEKEKEARLKKINDGKNTQTLQYEESTGAVKELFDSAISTGAFVADYDVEGNMTSENYPNGMTAIYAYNPVGESTSVVYKKETHCTEKCEWYKDSIVPSIHGQWMNQTSTFNQDIYTYDGIGRLTEVQDTPTGKGCTTHHYTYDEDTNRTSLTAYPPNAKNECSTESPSIENHTYDEADRLTDTGASYEAFGNTTSLSAGDAGGSELTSTFYVDDQAASQKQAGESISYDLDPEDRINEIISTGKIVATETNHYAGPGSMPSWTGELSGKWTENIGGIGGELVAVDHSGETILQLANLHGDIVATASLSETASEPASTIKEANEYGVPATEAPPKYSWLGAHEIPTTLPSGVTTMGARSYIPQLGRFLQKDPIPGGSANPYAYTNGDPLNETDLTGQYVENNYLHAILDTQSNEAVELEKQREQAAREQAAHEQATREQAAREEAERLAAQATTIDATYAAMNTQNPYGEEEEWWEEENEYENASYHPDSKGQQEAHPEPGLLYQPIGENPSEDQIIRERTNLVALCQSELSNHKEYNQYGYCATYVHWYSGIEKDVGHVVHTVLHWLKSVPATHEIWVRDTEPRWESDTVRDLDDWGFDDVEWDW